MDDQENRRAQVRSEVRSSMDEVEMTNAQLAQLAKVDAKTVNDFVAGRRWPQRKSLSRITTALGWAPARLEAILSGVTDEPTEAAAPTRQPSMFRELLQDVDVALGAFHAAVSEMVKAEAAFDNAMNAWARAELLRQRLVEFMKNNPAYRSGQAGSVEEAKEIIAALPRPTPAELAEFVAWSAMHDDRDWTRYEMALIEVVEPDYPQDVRRGSRYVDIEPFRERVRRLGRIPTTTEHEQGATVASLAAVVEEEAVPDPYTNPDLSELAVAKHEEAEPDDFPEG